MELTIEQAWSEQDYSYVKVPYTVFVDDHRILTFTTDCSRTAGRWLKSVLKSHNNKFGSLLVGVNAERCYDYFKEDNGPNSPYDILVLCVGSHCLIYNLHGRKTYSLVEYPNLKCFDEFFSASHVVAVGVDMASVAKNLEKNYGIRFANPTDLNQMAVKGVKRDDLDLANYDVDRLATAVLGQEYWIERPEEKFEWFDRCWPRRYSYGGEFTDEKVMYGTFDSYFVYLIGSKLLEMLNGDCGTGSGKKSMKKKKKKRGH